MARAQRNPFKDACHFSDEETQAQSDTVATVRGPGSSRPLQALLSWEGHWEGSQLQAGARGLHQLLEESVTTGPQEQARCYTVSTNRLSGGSCGFQVKSR